MAHRQPLADIEFIADFAAYARGRGDVEYVYTSSCNCALSQFLRDTGKATRPTCCSAGWQDLTGWLSVYHPLPDGMDNPAELNGGDGRSALREFPRTFSALAGRLEALIVDAPVVERAR